MSTFKPFPMLIFTLKACVFIFLATVKATANDTIEIGAIIDLNSRIGKEQKTAINIAVENYNHDKRNNKQLITVHFRNTSKDTIQDFFTAEELVEHNHVKMIVIGMQNWEETALIADIGKRHQIPIVSFVTASYTPELGQLKWPFLVQMTASSLDQINCASSIVNSYQWRKVIVIYEDDMYSDSSTLAVLTETLRSHGVEVENQLILPQFSSLSDPREVVRKEVVKLLRKQSRVFIVVRSSVSTATHLFKEAKEIGLMGRDSAWILADSLADLLDSVDTTFISSIQGALGIKNHYAEATKSFQDFKGQFQRNFQSEYPMEDHSDPGIHALKAYDSITAFAKAVNSLDTKSSNDSVLLKNRFLSSNFTGLSGNISFVNGALSHPPTFRIVNVDGNRYKGLVFWSSKFGFSEVPEAENGERTGVDGPRTMKSSMVKWPGELKRVPKGWAMPTDSKPLIIGVPGRTSFEKFVKVETVAETNEKKYSGFCIDLFKEVLQILEKNYTLPYEFEPFDGSYPDLIQQVTNGNYDAIVGDITILAERTKYVEFTQPYAESGLTMVVPVKFDRSDKAWMFLKPFTGNMWIATGAVLVYTMLVVWFMEHHSNPEFRGRWKDQLGTAMWFTFSSLFFAHRESIKSNYTKTVVVVWFFLVFVLTSSYTASLTSSLTVPRLEPSVKNIEWIKRTNATVGCDGDSFVKDYLRQVLELQNIKNISNQDDYPKEFDNGNIKAAFLEIPYRKVFLREHCNQYVVAGQNYRFGGLAFKGSPLTRDVSEAILTLTQDGTLNRLEEHWFALSKRCDNDRADETESLTLGSFWGLYLVSGATSTICLLFYLYHLFRKSQHPSGAFRDNIVHPSTDQSFSTTTAGIIRYHQNGKPAPSLRRVTSARAASLGVDESGNSHRWQLGCDGSILISSKAGSKELAEKDAEDNKDLAKEAFEGINKAKALVESKCPGVVSCADILAIATRNFVHLVGGPYYEVKKGRWDGKISKASRVHQNLPQSNSTVDQLLKLFSSKGLTTEDLVALSGAHTIGFAHCKHFVNRIYNYKGTKKPDPYMDPRLLKALKMSCPQFGGNVDIVAPFDVTTPFSFDNAYYGNLEAKLGLLASDQALSLDPRTKPLVQELAKDKNKFFKAFAAAMEKMGGIGVKRGRKHGEFRKDCTVHHI